LFAELLFYKNPNFKYIFVRRKVKNCGFAEVLSPHKKLGSTNHKFAIAKKYWVRNRKAHLCKQRSERTTNNNVETQTRSQQQSASATPDNQQAEFDNQQHPTFTIKQIPLTDTPDN
jgi:hypothetical protein